MNVRASTPKTAAGAEIRTDPRTFVGILRHSDAEAPSARPLGARIRVARPA
jgi:hypothetical protein